MIAPVNSIFYSICFIFLSLIFIKVAKSELLQLHNNVTNHTSLRESDRMKRLISNNNPLTLQIKVKYETEDEISLSFSQGASYLANKYLPVITPFVEFNQNMMKGIGKFTTYYDFKKCSAIVYFRKLKALYGVIGMDYYIDGLPFDFNDNGKHLLGVVGQPYIKKFERLSDHIQPSLYIPPPSDTEAYGNYFRSSNYDENQGFERPSTCEAGPSTKRQRMEHDSKLDRNSQIDVEKAGANENKININTKLQSKIKRQDYYLEILIFVTRDIVELFKGSGGVGHHNKRIVRYLITYFNALDMMLRKARSPEAQVFINIAKIVIEDELTPFDFISDDEIQFSDVVEKLPKYLLEQQFYYKQDSFDHVFVYTSRTIMDGTIMVNGLTKHGANLYEARRHNYFYSAVPITMVKFEFHYTDYVVALHEISRALNIKIDPQNKELRMMGQCYGIMQQDGPKCTSCFEWSVESKSQFVAFFSSNKNRCFLLNVPRSIHPPGARFSLTPHQQCKCFGYHYFWPTLHGRSKSAVLPDGCDVPLQCAFTAGDRSLYLTVRPYDGTPCHHNKVCWDRNCVVSD